MGQSRELRSELWPTAKWASETAKSIHWRTETRNNRQGMILSPWLSPHIKKSERVKNLNAPPEGIKIYQENIDNIIQDEGIGKESVCDSRNMKRKAKIDAEFHGNGRCLDKTGDRRKNYWMEENVHKLYVWQGANFHNRQGLLFNSKGKMSWWKHNGQCSKDGVKQSTDT